MRPWRRPASSEITLPPPESGRPVRSTWLRASSSSARNLSVRRFPIGPGLAAALGQPVLVRGDVRVGGYAEYRLGAGRRLSRRDRRLFIGTGIGGCLVQEARLSGVRRATPGEIRHMIVKAGGPRAGALRPWVPGSPREQDRHCQTCGKGRPQGPADRARREDDSQGGPAQES